MRSIFIFVVSAFLMLPPSFAVDEGVDLNTYQVNDSNANPADLLEVARFAILTAVEERLDDLNIPGFQNARQNILNELREVNGESLLAQMENMRHPDFGIHNLWVWPPTHIFLTSHFTTKATLERSIVIRIDRLPEIMASTGFMANQGEDAALDDAYPRYCSNCFRHVYWSALMAKYYGPAIAMVVTGMHEVGYTRGMFAVGDGNDALMDIANDVIGAKLGHEMRERTNEEIYRRIRQMLDRGEIVIGNPEQIGRCVGERDLVASWSVARLNTYRAENRSTLEAAARRLTCEDDNTVTPVTRSESRPTNQVRGQL